MEKLDRKTGGSTPDIVEKNIEKLRELFPEVFTEGRIDFETLRETLGDHIDGRDERYSFTWSGKARARRLAQTPSTGTLRPCPEESVNWDTTQNLFIEGDNLEVLKLLQKSYHKKVKMIYIDPPYNTGNDFIYPDDFRDGIKNYMELTGQTDGEGRRLSTNAETSGRYHTDWLNMMYPRLRLARNLLRVDGVIFISIDDNESANLRKLCDEVFGEENFAADFVWEKKYTTSNNIEGVSSVHETILCYCRSSDELGSAINRLPYTKEARARYSNPDNDPRGDWMDVSYHGPKAPSERPNLNYVIVHPRTNEEIRPREKSWAYEESVFRKHVSEGRLYWGKDFTYREPRLKKFLSEMSGGIVPRTLLGNKAVGGTSNGRNDLRTIFQDNSGAIFDNPKPASLLRHLLAVGSCPDGIILDFFAGACTTAHAVLELPQEPGGNRKFIMVQLPEPCDEGSEAFKAGYGTIADIGKERIRRVIKRIESERAERADNSTGDLPGMAEERADLDLGFKVFKLDASNIRPWDADFDNLEPALFDAIENIKPDRTEADVLYELLLKYGLDLAVPIERREIAGKTVHIIGAGALIVCLAKDITLDVVEGIAALKEELKPEIMRVVFKDSGFKDDVVKTNAMQILHQAGVEDVKSL
ncbi:MAG TPA: site-specific DNA-methyltransferase [bacterium]|nr:site-specific DNA-methyltransferase [bacterium]